MTLCEANALCCGNKLATVHSDKNSAKIRTRLSESHLNPSKLTHFNTGILRRIARAILSLKYPS